MKCRVFQSLINDERGAVAVTYAVSLMALVAVAGVAFDYSRMATMDSELQNAADQAALSAVTQLDGTATAISRATTQASNLVRNGSVMGDDGSAPLVTIASLTFYRTAADAEADTNATTDPLLARFVRVTTATKRADYALTPIVAAAASGNMGALATAGMGSAICKVPPIMMCNPNESTDPEFNISYVGKGIKLVSVGGGGGAWAPGNFGYLNTGSGESNKILELKQALGWDAPPGDCLPQTGVDTSPGANTPVTHAINTRFDIYENGGPGGGACASGGTCTPSINTVKDLVRESGANGNGACGFGNNGWHVATQPYLPSPATRLPVTTPNAMGHPRDICHAVSSAGDCTPNEKIGDGNWDRATYFAVNYPGLNWQSAMTTAYMTNNVTRYQVYKWEIANRNSSPAAMTGNVGANRVAYTTGNGNNARQHLDHMAPICSGNAGLDPTNGIDRRTFPIAVVNCTAGSVNGNSSNVPVKKWMNVFLVEPSVNRARTGQQDVYVEPVSVQTIGNSDGGSAAVVRRDKPYLLK